MTQKKMVNGSKLLISNFIYRNRFCLAFITILVFLMVYGLESFADSYTGTFVSDDYNTYYSMNGNYYSFEQQSIFSVASNDGFDTTKIVGYTASAITAQYLAPYLDGSVNYSFTIVGSVSDNINSFDFSSVPYHIGCRASSSDDNTRCYAFLGDGNFGFIPVGGNTYYVISDSSFVVGVNFRHPNGGGYYYENVSNVSANGLYCYLIDYMQLGFLDFPYYLPTSDGSSGFTSFNVNSTDFSFSSDNYDFNYVVKNGFIVNPNAPISGGGDYEHSMYINVSDKMMCDGVKLGSAALPNADRIYIAYNDYIAQNPNKFKLKLTYHADVSGSVDAPNVLYNDYDFNESFESVKYIAISDFVNGQYDVVTARINTDFYQTGVFTEMTNSSGTNDFYHWNVFMAQNFGVGWVPSTGDGWFYSYFTGQRVSVPYDVSWGQHYLTLTVQLVYSYDSVEETTNSMYEMKYDILDWNSRSLVQNNLNINSNPEIDGDGNPIIVPSNNGSSVVGGNQSGGSSAPYATGGSALAYVAEGAVQVSVNSGGSLTPAFHIDDVNIANVAQTMNDVVSFFGNDRNENGFWGLMKSVYDFLPAGIWSAIAVGVSTVLGISIVKVTLSYFRK